MYLCINDLENCANDFARFIVKENDKIQNCFSDLIIEEITELILLVYDYCESSDSKDKIEIFKKCRRKNKALNIKLKMLSNVVDYNNSGELLSIILNINSFFDDFWREHNINYEFKNAWME